ncbi:MAG TPA: transposase [Candidatus Sulfotelmatobacter sp.]|nr:transposase [Candidatus Sulfotelmatobacter sp.]
MADWCEKLDIGWMNSEGPARRREDWQQLISEQKQSGLTVKAFCAKHGVGEALFYAWRKRVVAEDQPARFALVATKGVVPGAPMQQPLQLVLAGGERLEIPSGTDEATLRTVLGLLRQRV